MNQPIEQKPGSARKARRIAAIVYILLMAFIVGGSLLRATALKFAKKQLIRGSL